jgi:hypothetical protein
MATVLKDPQLQTRASRVSPEAKAAFDYTCRHYLKISGAEFLRLYDAGKFKPDQSNTKLMRVLAMLPFAR